MRAWDGWLRFGGPVLFGFFLSCAGCAPITPIVPFHFMETAKVLDKGELSASAALGSGSLTLMGKASGAGLRLRRGLGAGQEAGLEVLTLSVSNNDSPAEGMPWRGQSRLWAGRAGWKLELAPWVSVMAGLGTSDSATGHALSEDLGLLLSPPKAWGIFQPYLGLRGGLASPLGRGGDEAGGHSRGFAMGVGGALQTGRRGRVFLELGILSLANKTYNSAPWESVRQIQDFNHGGAYVGLGFSYLLSSRSKN